MLLINPYLQKWNCVPVGEPFSSESNFFQPAFRNKKPVMLKIVDPNDDEAHSADALKFFDGQGSVRLLESEKYAQLQERILPSKNKTLEQLVLEGKDDEATRIICEVIDKLHSVSKNKFPPPSAIPVQKRIDGLSSLVNDGTWIYLHGDIHHSNILYSENRGWLAIDPKGLLGPRIYEYANLLCNPFPHKNFVHEPNRMSRQAEIICEHAKLDKKLLLQTVSAHASQAAIWSRNDSERGYWRACAGISTALAGKIV